MSASDVTLSQDALKSLLGTTARPQTSMVSVLALAAATAALALSVVSLVLTISRDAGPAAPQIAAASPGLTASAAPAPLPAPAPVAAQAAPAAAAALPGAAASGSVRLAQSGGSFYAYDAASGLAFRFDPAQPGPVSIPADAIPADVRPQLLTGAAPVGAGTSGEAPGAIDLAAMEAQAAQAEAALATQTGDQSRPPINQLLGDATVAGEIRAALDQAQGIVRPTGEPDASAAPVVYAFFDPQCPHCHAAFAGLDGEFVVKWMPVSALGPAGDRLHAYILGDVQLTQETLEGGDIVQAASLGEDEERAARLDGIMRSDVSPPEATLSEGQAFVLAENAELFRLLSRGAEEMRAVPSFFIVRPDGTAVWQRGFDGDTPGMVADIVAGTDAS